MKIDWTSKKDNSMMITGTGLESLSSAKPQAPNMADLEKWKEIYKPPFKFDAKVGTTIFDADNNMVCQIRGWGRIQKYDNAEARQDAIGHYIAEKLTELYL